jgi:hypothetical protein
MRVQRTPYYSSQRYEQLYKTSEEIAECQIRSTIGVLGVVLAAAAPLFGSRKPHKKTANKQSQEDKR